MKLPIHTRSMSTGLLLLKLYAGIAICQAGFDKFPTSNRFAGNWFAGQVADLGFPAPVKCAFLAAFSEFAGGALLVLGLFSRSAAFFCAFTMGVASFAFHNDSDATNLLHNETGLMNYYQHSFEHVEAQRSKIRAV